MLLKLNKLIYKVDALQTKMNVIQEKVSEPLHTNEEFNVPLPIGQYDDLMLFEEHLQEDKFKNHVVNEILIFHFFTFIGISR